MENWSSRTTREKPEIRLSFIWNTYHRLVSAVRSDHIKQKTIGGSHDFLHAAMVANYSVLIAPDERTAVLAWVAAICHNTDRLWPDFNEPEVKLRVAYYLASQPNAFGTTAVEIITQAVLDHHKPNEESDSSVTIVLKDADRIANMGPNMILRSGQHYHKLPAYDPRFVSSPDPRATYRNPMTVLHDVLCAREWFEIGPYGIRLAKARDFARKYYSFLVQFQSLMTKQLTETYLDDYPFADDYELCYQEQLEG